MRFHFGYLSQNYFRFAQKAGSLMTIVDAQQNRIDGNVDNVVNKIID